MLQDESPFYPAVLGVAFGSFPFQDDQCLRSFALILFLSSVNIYQFSSCLAVLDEVFGSWV
jgi:hypothetical protein